MTVDLFLQASTAAFCAVVVLRAEPSINRMSGSTQMIVRLSFYQLAAAAGAELLAILAFGYSPGWREALLSGGVASLMMCERRIRLLSRASQRRTAP